MAYVVLFFKDQEVARRKLDGPVVIGRSAESDLSIRDILLSRRHCQIELEGNQWLVSDLGSKNGTRIAGQPILRQPLRDGDVIRIGNSTVRFYAGKLPATNGKPRNGALPRPADPMEALQNTVTDFRLEPRGPARNTDRLPVPNPSPREPASYVQEDVRTMVKDLVSSSWDSIYEHASRPDPVMPRGQNGQPVRRRPREPGVDLALQLRSEATESSSATATAEPQPEPKSLDLQPSVPQRRFNGGRVRALLRRIAMIFQWTALLMLAWHQS